jgi:TetR/AcrR family transcriptional regulator, cholesterol catabolism regulator
MRRWRAFKLATAQDTLAMKAVAKSRRTAASRPGQSKAGPVSSGRTPRGRSASDDAPNDLREAVMRLKRERIVAASVELFNQQGYGRTTLDQVADSLNMTKPFIYQYFKSKNEILADICSRAIKIAHDSLDRAIAQQGTPTARLQTITRDFMQAVLEHQAHAAIYSREEKELSAADREAINALRRKFDHRLVDILKAGVATGEFQVEDVQMAALAIGGIIGWSPVWYRPQGRLTREEVCEKAANLVLSMVRAKSVSRR